LAARWPRRRSTVISAIIDIAISSGVMAPRSSRRLDAIERPGRHAGGNQLFAQRRHLAAAADKGVIGRLDRDGLPERGFVALALRRYHDEAARVGEIARLKTVNDDMRIGLTGAIGRGGRERDVKAELTRLRRQRHRHRARAKDHQ